MKRENKLNKKNWLRMKMYRELGARPRSADCTRTGSICSPTGTARRAAGSPAPCKPRRTDSRTDGWTDRHTAGLTDSRTRGAARHPTPAAGPPSRATFLYILLNFSCT